MLVGILTNRDLRFAPDVTQPVSALMTARDLVTAPVGTTLAELVATNRTPDLIAPFALERFHTDTLVSELAAAAVSH